MKAIEDFANCSIEDKKTLLIQNVDPMFNIKSARFFQVKLLLVKTSSQG